MEKKKKKSYLEVGKETEVQVPRNHAHSYSGLGHLGSRFNNTEMYVSQPIKPN